jgi:hypothetical protein
MKFSATTPVIYAFVIGLLVSCGDDSEAPSTPQNPIVGVWRAESTLFTIDGIEFRDYLEALYNGLGIPISDADLDEIIQDVNADASVGSKVEFESGGIFRITNTDNNVQSGTWSITDDVLTLSEDDESSTFTVQKLSGSELHLHTQLDEESSSAVQVFEGADVEAVFTFTR